MSITIEEGDKAEEADKAEDDIQIKFWTVSCNSVKEKQKPKWVLPKAI